MRHRGQMRAARGFLLVAMLVVVFAARSTIPVLAASATVTIGDGLDPASLQVTPGTTVIWTNASGERHRMRTTSGPAELDSGDLDPGESYSATLTAIGTYQYIDDRNQELSNYWGTITVAIAPTSSPTPTPKPGATAAPTALPPPGDILMAGRLFSPSTVTVDAGTAVRWRNNDSREHTVSASNRSFDSGIMAVGATFTKVFSTPGTYAYLCLIHPDMTGTIAVRGAAGATPPPPPPPTPTPRPTPISPPAPGTGTVRVVDFAFDPGSVDVIAGTPVSWVNSGAALHTVTAADGSFDSGLVPAGGGRYSRRFATPGTFPYICSLHPSMSGVVRVSSASGGTAPPAAPPTTKPTPPPVGAGDLELRDFAFVPSAIRVSPGATVSWVNTGAAPHTVTDRAGSFDSGILARGARYSRTFAAAGTYQLICSIHPDMHATLVVAAPGESAPPPGSPPPIAIPPPDSGDVAIADFEFAPQIARVPVGTTVKWTNRGVAPHTVTAKDGSFDSGFLNTGESFARQFTVPAVVEYLCAIHPAMVGTIIVGGGAGPTSSPGASASPGSGSPPSSSPPGAGAEHVGLPPPQGPGGAGSVESPGLPLGSESTVGVLLVGLLWLGALTTFGFVIRATVRHSES